MSESINKFFTEQNVVTEINFFSSKKYNDPFNEIILDAVFENPKGNIFVVPAFWAGENLWKVRYSSDITGEHSFVTKCNYEDKGLNKQEGIIEVHPYTGNNKLIRHGSLTISKNSKYLKHKDGTPFLWLADTWWFALTKRCEWPYIFKTITEDRLRKGFSVIHLVVGLYPNYGKNFAEYNISDGGYVWDEQFNSINPTFFDAADLKINCLIYSGILPCIFGSWGYYLEWLGIEKMKKHWRYIIARWGAYQVAWCVAGEASMPYYIRNDKYWINPSEVSSEINMLRRDWGEISKYIRETDPFKNPITIHPSPRDRSYSSRDVLDDSSLYDFDMLQTGHYGKNVLEFTMEKVFESLNSKPKKPVINGEVCYEGIIGSYWQEVQRFLFWTHMLTGCAGFSYGAVGIMEFRNEKDDIEIGGKWGESRWEEALCFLGSYQIGLGKKLLERFDWYNFEPHADWIDPHSDLDNRTLPYCAGIPGKVRIIYFPALYHFDSTFTLKNMKLLKLDKNLTYKRYYFNPRNGRESKKIIIKPNNNGEWRIVPEDQTFDWRTPNPSFEDWVLILEENI